MASGKYAYRSYSIANGMNGKESVEKEIGGGVTAKSISDIKKPASKYVFVEQIDPEGYNGESWSMFLNKPQWKAPLALWHDDCSPMSFADGHVETHLWDQDKVLTDMYEKAKAGDTGFFTEDGIPTTADNPAWLYMKNGWHVK